MTLVAAVSRSSPGATLADAIGLDGDAGEIVLTGRLDDLLEARVEVLVDFTSPAHAPDHVAWGIANGVHVVVGTTGFEIDEAWRAAPVGVIVAPNFAIGAVLLMRFAEQAARHLPSAEVIELHHDAKADAPSGTALLTARRIAAAEAQCIRRAGGRRRRTPAPGGPTSTACACTPCACRVSSPTRRSCSAGRVRPSSSATTRSTAPRSCPA